mgnify:CR=1 FL=1
MKNQNVGLFCDPSNPGNFKEFTYTVPYFYPTFGTNGTITVPAACTIVTGSGTRFTSDLVIGSWINIKSNTSYTEYARKVVSITDDTTLVLDEPFLNAYNSATGFYAVPPPTTAWSSSNSSTQISGLISSARSMMGANLGTPSKPGSVITPCATASTKGRSFLRVLAKIFG